MAFIYQHGEVWEDSHGTEEKILKQVIFLPHQILGSLFQAGKRDLVAGNAVPCFNDATVRQQNESIQMTHCPDLRISHSLP